MPRSKPRYYGATKARPGEAAARPPELDLAGAATLAGLEQEIGLLRALVKRAVQLNQDDEARRLVLALCGALRLQQTLSGQPVGDHDRMLAELLEEVRLEPEPAAAGPEAG
jgi:hypothetical protein